jgi:hypothetical protein
METATMLDQFALRPTPIYGESAADHLIRLFQANGVPWGSPQLQAKGVRLASLTTGSEAKLILTSFGLAFDKFRQHTPYDAYSKSIGFMGQKLHRDHWTTERRRWCPVCWEEDLSQGSGNRPAVWQIHQRAWWSCTAIASCPIHNVLLENACPECDRPTFWYVGSMLYCQHKHSLRSRKVRPIPEEHTLADKYVLGRFGIWPQAAVPLLSSLSLRDALDAITVFGAVKLDGPTPSLRALRTGREPEMMSAGLAIAKGWPDAFIDLLANLGSGSGIGKWGVERLYGTLYSWAKNLPETEFGEEVRRVFFGSVGDSGFVTRRSVVSQYTSSSWVTLKEMADMTGYSTAVIKRFLVALGHDVPATKSGTPVAFSCHVLDHLKAALSKKLNLGELAKYLGITKHAALDLLRQGLISEDKIHAAARPGFHHVAQEEADRFLAAIRGNAPVRHFDPDATVSIPKLSQRAAVGGVAGICRMILDGTLTPRAIRAADTKLSGVLLKVSDGCRASLLWLPLLN